MIIMNHPMCMKECSKQSVREVWGVVGAEVGAYVRRAGAQRVTDVVGLRHRQRSNEATVRAKPTDLGPPLQHRSSDVLPAISPWDEWSRCGPAGLRRLFAQMEPCLAAPGHRRRTMDTGYTAMRILWYIVYLEASAAPLSVLWALCL